MAWQHKGGVWVCGHVCGWAYTLRFLFFYFLWIRKINSKKKKKKATIDEPPLWGGWLRRWCFQPRTRWWQEGRRVSSTKSHLRSAPHLCVTPLSLIYALLLSAKSWLNKGQRLFGNVSQDEVKTCTCSANESFKCSVVVVVLLVFLGGFSYKIFLFFLLPYSLTCCRVTLLQHCYQSTCSSLTSAENEKIFEV